MLRFINEMVGAFERGALTRRELVERMGAFCVAAAGVAHVAGADEKKPGGGDGPTFQATDVNHIALRVTDVARSRDWYVKHLGMRVTSDNTPRTCFLSCGPDFLALFRGEKAGMDHYCYTIKDYDPSRAVETLKKAGLDPTRRGNRVYFPDPDGLEVQVSAPN